MNLKRALSVLLVYVCLCGVGCQLVAYDGNLVKNVLEGMVNSKNGNTSVCGAHLKDYWESLLKKEIWAWKLFDSSSKIPTALLAGNIADLGFYDECLSVKHERQDDTIRGKYCKAAIPLEKIIPGAVSKTRSTFANLDGPQTRGAINLNSAVPRLTLALCMPDSCDAEILNSLLNETPVKKLLNYTILNCQSSEPEPLSAGDWVTVAFFALILAIMILSTAYDLYIQHIQQKPAHLILTAFSVYTNGKKLLTINKNSGQLECINGIRFISMMWVVIGHTHYTAFFSPSINALDATEWGKKLSSMYVLGATISVDTFFVVGGMLMSYVYLSAKDKGIQFNIFMYYVHRYIRLTPSFAMMMLVHVTFLKYLGSGPYWPEIMDYLGGNCRKYWWSGLLYVQNFVNAKDTCLGQTWYLSVDMQLFILSPLLLIPLGKWPKVTLQVSVFVIILSIVGPFVSAWINEFSGIMTEAIFQPSFADYYYMSTYTRFGPTVVGIVLGYFVYHKKENVKLNAIFKNKYLNLLGWIISFGSLVVITFAPNNMFYHEYIRLEASLFLGMHRVAWAIALAWIIYACLIGHGGIVNTFLSLSAFQVLGRLTYSMYLIHLSLQFMKLGYLRVPIYFSDFQNMYNFWGDFVFTAAIAIVWTLAFESPILILEKMIFKTGAKKPIQNEGKTEIKCET